MKKKVINERWRNPDAIRDAQEELKKILQFLNRLAGHGKKIAVFMGSARAKKEDLFYEHSCETAKLLGEKKYIILTGGGTGIMQAANEGAKAVNARSIGIAAKLLKDEQVEDSLFDHKKDLTMFFNRRFALLTVADVVIVYPGGLGTLNEYYELIMLLQQKIVDNVPIFLIQSRNRISDTLNDPEGNRVKAVETYWETLKEYMTNHLLEAGYIGSNDHEIGTIIDIENVSPEMLAEEINREVKKSDRD